jgi:NADH-quinone oxidoreductase subunit I
MTKTYDYSEYDIRNMVYHFTDLSPEQAEQKKKLYEEKELVKAKAKAEADAAKKASATTTLATPVTPTTTAPSTTTEPKTGDVPEVKKPAFKPVFKPGPVKPKPNPDQDKKE